MLILDWLFGKARGKELPNYSRLKSIPTRCLPPKLAEEEESESYSSRRDALEREILERDRRPSDDQPLFTELVISNRGVMTLTLPDDARPCLLVFSTPIRAADYVRTLLSAGPPVSYLTSSPLQFIRMLRDLEGVGIRVLALDRCPRCSIFTTIGSSSLTTTDGTVKVWGISKATEMARADLYLNYALHSARAGELEVAREVALETVGHVTLEDPRVHLLLGQLAVRLKDRKLLREAKAFLRFLRHDRWERMLDQASQSGSPDFGGGARTLPEVRGPYVT